MFCEYVIHKAKAEFLGLVAIIGSVLYIAKTGFLGFVAIIGSMLYKAEPRFLGFALLLEVCYIQSKIWIPWFSGYK